jgi:hypothetical protein
MRGVRVLNRSICLVLLLTSAGSIYFLEAPSQPLSTVNLEANPVEVGGFQTASLGSRAIPTESSHQPSDLEGGKRVELPGARIGRRETRKPLDRSPSERTALARFESKSARPLNSDAIPGTPAQNRRLASAMSISPQANSGVVAISTAPSTTGPVQAALTFPAPKRFSEATSLNTGNQALLPAVLLTAEANILLNSLQATDLQRMVEDFVQEIGSTEQNASDPDYRTRWQSAQEISDARFRQKFGTVAFLKYNAEAGRQRSSQ